MRRLSAGFAWFGAILLVAIAARVWTLDRKNVWLDEAVSWEMATMPANEMIAATRADIHPPGYYLALSGWVALFGDAPSGLRSFSAFFSVIAVLLTFALARRLVPLSVALAVVVWLALAPHAIHYAQEARMYALATAAVLAACLTYAAWRHAQRRWRTWLLAAYVVSAATAIYAHYFTALPLAALVLHQAFWPRTADGGPRGVRGWPPADWAIANVAIVLLYLPWIGVAITHGTRGQPWRAPVESSDIITHLGKMTTELMVGYYGPAADAQVPAMLLWVGIATLVVQVGRRRDADDALLLLLALVPLGLAGGLLLTSGYMQLSRYLAFALPLLLLASARGFVRAGVRPWVVAAAFLVATVWSIPSLRQYYRDDVKDSDYRPIVALIQRAPDAAGRTVFLSPSYMTGPFRYAARDAVRSEGVPRGVDLHAFLAQHPGAGWLVVDYRSPDFGPALDHPRLLTIDLPLPTARLVRLFAIQGAAASPHE